ncbi:MAG: hypothetical protein LBD74_02745 [Spirochaetaceae bacterium]|jgi:hypothetical protein|nr:hypothetical protein [Spirochaetaceae bacterium]
MGRLKILLIIGGWGVFGGALAPVPLLGRTNFDKTAVPLLMGTEEGLYRIDWRGSVVRLWGGGAVRSIKRTRDYWALLSDQGITLSTDLQTWEDRNQGLPMKVIKVYDQGKKSFIRQVQDLKDFEIHPENPDIMVCAVKDAVFLTRNAGKSWENQGMPPYQTNGIKAVALANLPDLTIFLSHSVYGVYYLQPDLPKARWIELAQGLETLETTDNPDEVSDIAVVLKESDLGQGVTRIFAAQTFRPRIYELLWEEKAFRLLWKAADPGDALGTVDALDPGRETVRFVRDGSIDELPYPQKTDAAGAVQSRRREDILKFLREIPRTMGLTPSCIFLGEERFAAEPISLSELWLIQPEQDTADPPTANREGIYLPVNHAMSPQTLKPYMDLISRQGLNLVVLDMKDDYGRLRFTPKNAALTAKGRVFRPLDIDAFLGSMKERKMYTVARIVVFKDPELAKKEGGKFAVWDARNKGPWQGYYDSRQKKQPPGSRGEADNPLIRILPAGEPDYEIVRTYYDEHWVDPYSEEVWDYHRSLAQELHERGFDEIQFDYIRFPTDGANLADAQYRWKDPGMDMDSALISFLRHIRSQVDAPLSIDIYGANGWYRTGSRTGQEVELLVPYVDVICPMYYPSHFEQHFLAQYPPERRPYRIYYQGTQRAQRISRRKVVIRPYVQAFYLNVSYDRTYYNQTYVRLEVEGVRAAGTGGLIYWNNLGRYDDIPPIPPRGLP